MEDYTFLIGFGVVAVAVIVGGLVMRKSDKKHAVKKTRATERAKKIAELSNSLKKIEWENRFAIDGGVIDKGNKTLFGLVNEFNESIPDFETPGQMLSLLASIKKYTQTHFPREEKLQLISDFPFCEEHKKEHEALIEKLNGWIEKTLQANEDNVTDVAGEIGLFLVGWITGHVVESDLPLKPYVDRLRENAKNKGNPA